MKIKELYELLQKMFSAYIYRERNYLGKYPAIGLVVKRSNKTQFEFLNSKEIDKVIELLQAGKVMLEKEENK